MGEIEKLVPKRRFEEFINSGDWEQRKLDKLVDVRSGRDYKHLSEGDIPVYGTGGYMLSVDEALSYDEDAIGIGRKGTIDNPYILRAPFWTVDTLFYSVPREECDLNFVFDIFQKVNWKQKDESTGVPSLSKTTINNVQTFVPNFEEQKEIGAYFSSLDALITLHQRKVKKIKALKYAYLSEMFPAEGECKPKRRFVGFTEEWEQRKLGEVVDFLDGDRRPLESGERESGIYPYYGASGIIDYVKDYIFDEELILLSEDGANIVDRNYRVCFLASGKYWVNNHAHVMKAKKNYCNNFICESLEYLEYDQYNTGTAQPKLNQEVCRNIQFRVPSLEEQVKIGTFMFNFDNLITLHQQKLEKLQNIKKAFLNEMLI